MAPIAEQIEIIYSIKHEVFIRIKARNEPVRGVLNKNISIWNVEKQTPVEIKYIVNNFYIDIPCGEYYIGFECNKEKEQLILMINKEGYYFEPKNFYA